MLVPSSRHASRERLVPRPVSRLVLLACLVCLTVSSSHPLPPRVLLLASSARLSHRLIGSPPCLVSPRACASRQAGRGETIGGRRPIGGWIANGWRMLTCLGWRTAAVIGGRAASHRRTDGGGCLLASGRWTERLDRFVDRFPFSLIGSSNRLGSLASFHLSHHLIDGEWSSFPFRPTPSRLLFSACLPGLVPPSPAGGCEGYGMSCDGGRRGCLLAFSCPVSLSRCRSFARCYTICVDRAARSCLGRRMAFYGLFCPLSCRR